VDTNDVQKTFQYVITHHPHGGRAVANRDFRPKFIDKTFEEFAKCMAPYADAVAVFCCEKLGKDVDIKSDSVQIAINTTTYGNVAYIALHHSDTEIRKCHLDILHKVVVYEGFYKLSSPVNNSSSASAASVSSAASAASVSSSASSASVSA
jgi:hypothetical protein